MSHDNQSKSYSSLNHRTQKGAVFLVMIVILTLGVITTLVATLSTVSLHTARNEKSSDLLAQVKDIVIGYAINGSGGSYGQSPGDMITPDSFPPSESPADYDGTFDTRCLDVNQSSGLPLTNTFTDMRCLGRLPWKSYNLSIASASQNDPTGFMPWYAVSTNLIDPDVVINSELINNATHPWITVRDMNGNVLKDTSGNNLKVAFVIIIPGSPINGQSRPASPLGGADQYLESITVPIGCTAPCVPGTYSNSNMYANKINNNEFGFIIGDEHRWINDSANPGKQIEDNSYFFNDKILYVTIDELMPLIEKRIAREVKKCLDDYANTPTSAPSHKYPWPAKVSNDTAVSGTLFGRVPAEPTITAPYVPSNSDEADLWAALGVLQTAVNNCATVSNSTNRNALDNAGQVLEDIARTVRNANTPSTTPMYKFANAAKTAGNNAQDAGRCTDIHNNPNNNTVQNNINTANTKKDLLPTSQEDTTMEPSWPSGCFVSGGYWDAWKNLVFYQIDDKYSPNGTTAACANNCLSISGDGNINSGSGNYRAVVALAGKMRNGQPSRNNTLVTDYLEGANLTGKSDVPSTKFFETYKSTHPSYQTINDLVLCLDNLTNCQ